jgi:hypothetical protein
VQVLWFAGVNLTQTTFAGDSTHSAEEKKRVFSTFEDPNMKKRIRVPAIIIECYSHGKIPWAQRLLDNGYRQSLAEAIARGSLDYHLAKYRKK